MIDQSAPAMVVCSCSGQCPPSSSENNDGDLYAPWPVHSLLHVEYPIHIQERGCGLTATGDSRGT